MTPEELFEEKEHLVLTAIKEGFGSYLTASQVAENNNMEFDDLVQVGKINLWELCLKHNPEKIGGFNTYAVMTIKWKMIHEVHEKGRMIKVSRARSPEERNRMQFHSIDLHQGGEYENGFFAVDPVNVEEVVMNTVQCEELLSGLSSEERLILVKKSHGFTDEEIAKEIGKDRFTINRKKRKAYKKINPDYKRVIKGEIRKKKNHLLAQVI